MPVLAWTFLLRLSRAGVGNLLSRRLRGAWACCVASLCRSPDLNGCALALPEVHPARRPSAIWSLAAWISTLVTSRQAVWLSCTTIVVERLGQLKTGCSPGIVSQHNLFECQRLRIFREDCEGRTGRGSSFAVEPRMAVWMSLPGAVMASTCWYPSRWVSLVACDFVAQMRASVLFSGGQLRKGGWLDSFIDR